MRTAKISKGKTRVPIANAGEVGRNRITLAGV